VRLREREASVERSRDDAERSRDELAAELDSVRLRQADSLEFTNRVTARNSELQADNQRLAADVRTGSAALLIHTRSWLAAWRSG